MSATGQLIAALVAGGMDASEAAGLVARAAVEMTGALTRKSAGAKRQQRYRERNKASQTVTRDDDENRNETSQSVTSLRSEETSQSVTNRNESVTRDAASLYIEKKEEIKKEKRESTRGTQLPSGWRPDAESWADAIALLGSEQRAEYELKKFTDHALEKGRVAKNWNAAWRNWTKRAVEFGGKNGNAVVGYRTDPVAGRATAREAQHVASVGDAALQYLRQSKPTGSDREAPGDFGFAGFPHADSRAKGPH